MAKTLQLDPTRIGEKLKISSNVGWSLSGPRGYVGTLLLGDEILDVITYWG